MSHLGNLLAKSLAKRLIATTHSVRVLMVLISNRSSPRLPRQRVPTHCIHIWAAQD